MSLSRPGRRSTVLIDVQAIQFVQGNDAPVALPERRTSGAGRWVNAERLVVAKRLYFRLPTRPAVIFVELPQLVREAPEQEETRPGCHQALGWGNHSVIGLTAEKS